MLSFNDLQEKKTKIKLNPKKDDVMEGSCGSMPKMAKGGAIASINSKTTMVKTVVV